MIRSIALVRNQNGDAIFQILLDRDGVEYKKMSRAELLDIAERVIKLLLEDETMG